jgi:excisionase family DNA binding protein
MNAQISPRCLDRAQAAAYIGVSEDTIDRLIAAGQLSVVRLPVTRHRNGVAVSGVNRRVLCDRTELDALVERSREKRT